MKKELMMKTNNEVVRISKKIIVALSIVVISACADREILTMDEPVKQLNNLADYDSDGVVKARDKCDETVLGASIDNYGCGSKIAQLEPYDLSVKFAHNSYDVPNSAYANIKGLAEFLEKYPEAIVVIEGHTSKVGTEELNQALSENRAKAVADMLVNDFNIDQTRVSSVGYGFDELAILGDSEEAHSANRRIIAEISASQEFDIMEWTIYSVDQSL